MFQWFSYDLKASLGAVMALIAAFVPIVNIWWTVMAIHDTPMEIKKYVKRRKDMKRWRNML